MSIEPVSVSDAVGAVLRSRLLSGMFSAGAELRDTMIAKEFGVARPTVRVAVQQLVAEGLLERDPGHSARVRSFSAADVVDIYRIRRLIEFECVRLITRGGRDTAPIAEVLRDFAKAGDSQSWETGPDADTAFHTAVVHASGSERLSRMFVGLASEMRLMIAHLRPRYEKLNELYAEHAELLDALQAQDTDRALDAWSRHLADAENYLITTLTKENR